MSVRVRDAVTRMAPYSPGKPLDELERELGITGAIKLASNENPWVPSPKALEAARDAAARMNTYPDASAHELVAALSRKLTVEAQQILVGNGSDELISMISHAILEPGDKIVMGDPGFSQYNAGAEAAGAETIKVPLDRDARHDLPAMARAAQNARIVWIANPNNPTGTTVQRKDFDAFLEEIPDSVLVVLDEAYYEFVDDPEYPDSLSILRERDNVCCLRTFSKTYGLAGIRVGYGVFPRQLAGDLARLKAPFNVNIVAQAAAVAALGDQAYLCSTIERNANGVREITRILQAAGARVAPSFANFVWAEVGPRAQEICDLLLQEGVIVRSGRIFGKPECLRVSVGTPDEIRRFESALTKVMEVAVA